MNSSLVTVPCNKEENNYKYIIVTNEKTTNDDMETCTALFGYFDLDFFSNTHDKIIGSILSLYTRVKT